MVSQSVIERNDVFFATATFGAHANGLKRGFRQRDVKFFIELFYNWVDPRVEWEAIPVQNTHISRYIDSLVREGFARQLARKGYPRYMLTRSGLFELISRVVRKPYYFQFELFFFVYSYIENYTPRARALVRREGSHFPYSLKLEIESLLDLNALLERQLEFVRRELKILEQRIELTHKTEELGRKMLADGVPFAAVTKEVEKRFPYSLNTRKPFSEFMAEGTEKQAIWELIEGGPRRVQQMWEPARDRLLLHIEQLEALRERSKKRQAGE